MDPLSRELLRHVGTFSRGGDRGVERLDRGWGLGIEIAFTTPEAHRAMKHLSKEYRECILLAGRLPADDEALALLRGRPDIER